MVISDQKALKFLLKQREVQPQYQQWLTKLLGYDFEILYQPGLNNKAADALSRRPDTKEMMIITTPTLIDVVIVQKEVHEDELQAVVQKLLTDPSSVKKYSLEQGKLLYKGWLVLSSKSTFVPALLTTFHDSVLGGHSRFLRTYKRLVGELYWKGMKDSVKKHIAKCIICQRNKHKAVAPAGLLQPLPIPDRVWDDISMDFIEKLPISHGFDTLVVVDRLSKYSHFIPLKHPFTAKTMADVFLKEIIWLHGFPRSIVSDRDKIFVSHFWTELFTIQGIRSTFHPQTDGQTERVNRCVETYLRCFCNEQLKQQWIKWIPWAEYWYFNISINTTPYSILYGRPPPHLVSYGDRKTSNDTLEQQLIARDKILVALKEHLSLAPNRMKKFADQHRRELEFNIGDEVFLKLRPY